MPQLGSMPASLQPSVWTSIWSAVNWAPAGSAYHPRPRNSKHESMSYLVLARKWRPKNFAELVGQEHVVRALSNGLKSGRLHHAFLFTGTRGVGKTTIARIIAKALNCETGVTATPCGICNACTEIDQGRYPDLMEIDAASRTKVDDTRELLDNVIYAPTKGRFKVYLIDEVHMLSMHSFNALLKTLEEPPDHVKFVLATTDPQKLPVTVLSRCLKFHLRRLSQIEISTQMQMILGAEQIPFEQEALDELARAADGSMRDGLSLLDQAIGYGAGEVRNEGTRQMLGTTARDLLLDLLIAIAAQDSAACEAQLRRVVDYNPNYLTVAAQLMELLHDAALIQRFGQETQLLEVSSGCQALADAADPARLQLLYQIALTSARDLQWAPDARIAFEMAVLRMLAFTPDRHAARDSDRGSDQGPKGPSTPDPKPPPLPNVRAAPDASGAPAGMSAAAWAMQQMSDRLKAASGGDRGTSAQRQPPMQSLEPAAAQDSPQALPALAAPSAALECEPTETALPDWGADVGAQARVGADVGAQARVGADVGAQARLGPTADHADWGAFLALAEQLRLSGPCAEILNQAGLLVCQENLLRLRVASSQAFLLSERSRQELSEKLAQLRPELKLEIDLGGKVSESLATRRAEILRQQRIELRAEIEHDPSFQALQREYGAVVIEDSIELLTVAGRVEPAAR